MKTIFSSGRCHYLARVSIFLTTVALIIGMVGCDTTPTTVEIRDWDDLNAVRDNLGGSYLLMNDLDSTTAGYEELASETANLGKGWQPIGPPDSNFFTGIFDGQGYEIRNLFINRPDEDYVGLFGYVDEGGHIEDIGAVEVTVTGHDWVGGLVGYNDYGTVSDSYSTASVSGDSHLGGLVGYNYEGTVSNSSATGSVTGIRAIGGLVGGNDGTVSNSYSTGSVTGDYEIGGLVGYNEGGNVSNSYSTGSVTGSRWVGGLVGSNGGTVSNSYYNYDETLINSENIVTTGALFGADFEEWLANDKFLDINDKLSYVSGYYVISDVSDFKQLLAFGQNASIKFRLTDDLDLATEPNLYIPYFAGEFDGNGHKISNLSFNFDFVSHVGLFGYLTPGGKVTHLGAEDANITATVTVSGLVGHNSGTVSNSYSTGSITGDANVGGLVGYNDYGTVSDSYSTASVSGDSHLGGLVGCNYEGTVSNSHSTGSVTSSVTGSGFVGGLAGYNYGTVSNSYSTGSVTGDKYVGGLVGSNVRAVSNSYSTGNVFGSWRVGGLVGMNDYGTVSNSYSTGNVTGDEDVGGLVGWKGGTVSDSFWDIETSGQATSDGGTGKTTTQMMDIATFSGATWDIIAVANPDTRNTGYIWNIVDDETYPFLSWQP